MTVCSVVQTFWRQFMLTNEAANSFPAEKNWKEEDERLKEEKDTGCWGSY